MDQLFGRGGGGVQAFEPCPLPAVGVEGEAVQAPGASVRGCLRVQALEHQVQAVGRPSDGVGPVVSSAQQR